MNNILYSIIKYLSLSSIIIFTLIWTFDFGIENNTISLQERFIGEPILIENMEVAEFDAGGLYYQIEETVREIGSGWRIPTREEYMTMCQHRNIVSNLKNTAYWTCEHNPKLKGQKIQYFIPSGKTQSVSTNKWRRLWDRSGADSQPVRFVRTR